VTLFLGILFGAIGSAYLAIARRQHDPTFLICGFILIIYPWFLSNAFLIVLLGAAVSAFPIARAKGLV
jgi:hypothetical protein